MTVSSAHRSRCDARSIAAGIACSIAAEIACSTAEEIARSTAEESLQYSMHCETVVRLVQLLVPMLVPSSLSTGLAPLPVLTLVPALVLLYAEAK